MKLLRWENDRFILYTVRLYRSKRFNPQYNHEDGIYYLEWEQFYQVSVLHCLMVIVLRYVLLIIYFGAKIK